jgi:hypothetical protein
MYIQQWPSNNGKSRVYEIGFTSKSKPQASIGVLKLETTNFQFVEFGILGVS